MLAGVLLLLAALIVLHSVWDGRTFTARVVAIADKTSRTRMLFAWAAGLYATYALSTQIALILLDRAEAIFAMPDEFRALAMDWGIPPGDSFNWMLLVGASMGGGLVLGASLSYMQRRRGKIAPVPKRQSAGTARSAREALPATILSISAGVSEELFFRLLLPLLIAIVFGSAGWGMLVSIAAFGLVHRYQGWIGMIWTAVIGTVLTFFYLLSGTLWAPIALHVGIDVCALVLRPMLAGRWSTENKGQIATK